MKIIHIITAFGIGGAEKLLLNVINRQIEDHEVHLIYLKKVDDLLSNLDKRVRVKNINFSIITTLNLRAYFKEVSPDIIHTHLGHADILGVWSARNLNCKVFSTMHNIHFKKNFLDPIFFEIYKFLYLRVVKTAQIVTISKSVENHVMTRLRIPKKRTHYLMNAIPNRDIPKLKQSKVKRINLLFVGRLEKQKSIETLLYAVEQVKTKNPNKEIQLKIVGDGKLRSKLEQLTKTLEIEKLVKFEGEKNEIDEFYTSSDIFILPSIWEGFGIVILEAFRARLAVIASNIEGPSELIEHKKSGLLFEPKNYVELAEQILLLITDETLRNEISEKGHATFTKKYHIDTYVNALNQLYKNAQ